MKPGLYRNHCDVELTVTVPATSIGGRKTLGLIWHAEAHDDIFGTDYYLVTEESLKKSGYKLIEEGADDE